MRMATERHRKREKLGAPDPVEFDRRLDPLRQDAWFKEIMKRIGLDP